MAQIDHAVLNKFYLSTDFSAQKAKIEKVFYSG